MAKAKPAAEDERPYAHMKEGGGTVVECRVVLCGYLTWAKVTREAEERARAHTCRNQPKGS